MTDQMPSGRTFDTDFMFTKLAVKDLDKSAAFYAAVFGLVEMHRLEATIVAEPVSEVVYLATYPNGPLFVLLKYHGVPETAIGEVTLGFSTKDLDALLARLEAEGGRLLDVMQDGHFRTAFAEDPEGHKLQITQSIG